MVEFFEYRDTRERAVGKEKVVRQLKNSSKATAMGKLSSFLHGWLMIKENALNPIPLKKLIIQMSSIQIKER